MITTVLQLRYTHHSCQTHVLLLQAYKSCTLALLRSAVFALSLKHTRPHFTCKLHHACFYLVSVRHSPDGATTDLWWRPSNCSLLLKYRPWKDKRL